jgi:uncharacterized protein (TIGR00725 family)
VRRPGGCHGSCRARRKEAGGLTIGILPGPDTDAANGYIDIPIATNVGHARNVIIVHTAMVLIAVSGGYGTLSEIALALKAGKRVVALHPQFSIRGVETTGSAKEAVHLAFTSISQHMPDR